MEIVLLAAALALILAGAELFTNGVEWMGRKLDLAEGAVGSVLAAVGTAMPETMIPIVAIVVGASSASGSHGAEGIGIGAILGAPFMLSTLAMFITGMAVYATARSRPTTDLAVDPRVLVHDLRFFGIAYILAIAAAFLPGEAPIIKLGVAAALLSIYAIYVKGHLDEERAEEAEELRPLRFGRLDPQRHVREPRLRLINFQVLAAVAAIVGGAIVFVGAVTSLAARASLDPTILALVITPIATELPEKFNSVIWIREGKDTLALGNITGAMVFQSCIPTVVALVLAAGAWSVTDGSLLSFASAGIALVSTAAIFLPMMWRGRLTPAGLAVGGAFYAGYLALVAASVGGVL